MRRAGERRVARGAYRWRRPVPSGMKRRLRLGSSRPFGSSDLLCGGFWLAGLLLVLTAIIAARQQNDDIHLRGSLSFQAQLSDVRALLQDAELGVRDHLLTGDSSLLAGYRRAVIRLPGQLDALGERVGSLSEQARAFGELRGLADLFMDALASILREAAQGGGAAGLATLRDRTTIDLRERLGRRIEILDANDDHAFAKRLSQHWNRRYAAVAVMLGLTGLMAILAHAALREARRSATLSKFLPSEIARGLSDGDPALVKGTKRMLAVAFVDLRGSTRLAERLPPEDFAALLAEFRRRISKAAQETSGVVDKFIGDGALVLFGLHDQRQAATNALAFADRLLREARAAADPPSPALGIGIHFGPVFCGVLGDKDRVEFTVLGDAVNVASRLEAHTKLLATPLAVSSDLLEAASHGGEGWKRSEVWFPGRKGMIVVHTMP